MKKLTLFSLFFLTISCSLADSLIESAGDSLGEFDDLLSVVLAGQVIDPEIEGAMITLEKIRPGEAGPDTLTLDPNGTNTTDAEGRFAIRFNTNVDGVNINLENYKVVARGGVDIRTGRPTISSGYSFPINMRILTNEDSRMNFSVMPITTLLSEAIEGGRSFDEASTYLFDRLNLEGSGTRTNGFADKDQVFFGNPLQNTRLLKLNVTLAELTRQATASAANESRAFELAFEEIETTAFGTKIGSSGFLEAIQNDPSIVSDFASEFEVTNVTATTNSFLSYYDDIYNWDNDRDPTQLFESGELSKASIAEPLRVTYEAFATSLNSITLQLIYGVTNEDRPRFVRGVGILFNNVPELVISGDRIADNTFVLASSIIQGILPTTSDDISIGPNPPTIPMPGTGNPSNPMIDVNTSVITNLVIVGNNAASDSNRRQALVAALESIDDNDDSISFPEQLGNRVTLELGRGYQAIINRAIENIDNSPTVPTRTTSPF